MSADIQTLIVYAFGDVAIIVAMVGTAMLWGAVIVNLVRRAFDVD